MHHPLLWSTTLLSCILSSSALPSVAQQLAFGLPAPHLSSQQSTHAPFKAFLNHFASPLPLTAVYLSNTLQTLHPNASSFLVTQDQSFLLGPFAAEPSNGLKLHEVEGSGKLSARVYVPAGRRRDGPGAMGERVTWAEYDVSWAGKSWKVIVAEWPEGFSDIRQSHLIGLGDTTEADSDLLLLSVSSYNTAIREAILVFDDSRWEADHALWQSVQKASWSDVILDAELKRQLQKEYQSFFTSERIYKDLGVPWKRGIIFLGPPGNGKTISLKAIMKASGVPTLYAKTFHTYWGDEVGIRMIFTRARAEAPCLLVLEDLDSLVTDENRAFLLNELDGLEDNDGLLVIGTTNHFNKLDPALSNRPSRFDRKYTFPLPVRAERRAYALYWQKKLSSNSAVSFPDSLLDEVAESTKGFSFSFLKEAFVSTLITLAGEEQEKGKQKREFAVVLKEQIEWLRKQLRKGEDGEDLA